VEDQVLSSETVQPEFRKEEYVSSSDLVSVSITTVVFIAVLYVCAVVYRKYFLSKKNKTVSQEIKVLETKLLPTGENISILDYQGISVVVASNRAGITLLQLAESADKCAGNDSVGVAKEEGKIQ
jgi:hypothetical protein